MIDKQSARELVYRYINAKITDPGKEVVILDSLTIGKEYGWIFFYNRKRYLETHDILDTLIGGGPIVVEKSDGSLHILGSALAPEDEIKKYEASRGEP